MNKAYKYPFARLIAELRTTEPNAEQKPAERLQWEKDVRALAKAIAEGSHTSFDPEYFCHSLGIPYSLKADTSRDLTAPAPE